ncbi:MAG: succinylglutamate desuccinylase/aspartoacylase family protein [Planctomycetia bacterium]|nr:succinylglutamate desuccinylase/aspartoacylase family protein [Planctomycetia bacterium]
MAGTQIHATVDFDKPGKQHGHLLIPYSYNLGGWANLMVPITVIQNGDRNSDTDGDGVRDTEHDGPTVLAMAGNHGDEYPGQVAILKLCRELQEADVRGRVILIPCLTMLGSKAMTRLSPLDGKNFNRCFPGNAHGTPSEMLAHYLTTVLFPMADIVIDIHTGGRSVDFVPCAHMHLVPDLNQRQLMMAGTEAWGSEMCFLYTDIAGTGLLPAEAESQGKIVITTEMGGGEPVTTAVHRLTQVGLRNVLIHFGAINGEKRTRAERGIKPARWVQALHREDYRFAPESGLYENVVALGEDVTAGQTVGLIHFIERPDREPVPVIAPAAGVLIACRGPSVVTQGDCVACIAHDVPADMLK